jgi:hypothetical protein
VEFLNTLKGSTVQTIIHCLLRQAGYPVVSTSIEALIPSLTQLDWAQYDSLKLGPELRLLPDLLLLPQENSARQVLEKCREQQQRFPDAYTIIVRGTSPRGAAARADDLIRVLPPNALELLAAADIFFHVCPPAEGGSEETRLEPLWQSLRPMTTVFDRLQSQREVLERVVPLIRALVTL